MPRTRMTRAEQHAQTRERLLVAAEQVIARLGYGGASIDLISAEAGYSKGAIYSNFDSKEDLFLALLEFYMNKNLHSLASIMGGDSSVVSDKLIGWINGQASDSNCLLISAELKLHARRNQLFADKYYEHQRQGAKKMAELIERYFDLRQASLPFNAMEIAEIVTAVTHGLSLQRPPPKPGEPASVGEVIDALMKQLARR